MQKVYNSPSIPELLVRNMSDDGYLPMNYFSPHCSTFQSIITNEYYPSLFFNIYLAMSRGLNSNQEFLQHAHNDHSESSESPVYEESTDDLNEVLFQSGDWIVCDKITGKARAPRQNEYLHLILENPRYSSYIQWLNRREGLFKIHQPERVASLWHRVKNRRTQGFMDYNTFARGIRYYYKTGVMVKTHKKYTFQFKIET